MTNFNEYKEILEAPEVTIHHLLKYFKKNELDYDMYGNVFVNFKKDNKKLPILVAHTDNVLGDGERHPVFSLDGKKLFCANNVGIGFDDKAGIIAIIELWKMIPEHNFRIMFTSKEEIGGVGAERIEAERYNQAAYIIELDRRGNKDIIQESGTTRLCSDKFAQKWEELGFKRDFGTFTDLNQFKPKATKTEMCNLSIGYYSAHTKEEYLDVKDFEKIVEKVKAFIIQNKGEVFEDTEEFEEKPKYNWYQNNYRNYSNYNNGMVSECDCCGRHTITTWNQEAGMYLCDDCNSWYEDETKQEDEK